ncbi:hypothetical protein O7599_23710 [Streptomyces sp. WMMC500]|uniref:hypothetical protein n=1 Tax=Streptomyces sp. WMMC500 TaxID=3015154 RepID=UPI00248ABB52|nr:hypothetical protein [Streptomyces sp. WMMC500]WBB58620.1 hypothetical protein O7599_23710 [Streptomyces sp. WMMC500]
MAELLDITVNCPADWVPLSLAPDEDLSSWADEQAAELRRRYEAEGRRARVRRLARDLEEAAATSRRQGALAAFGLYLSGYDSRVAALEIRLVQPDADTPEITLPWLAQMLTTRDPAHDVGPPDVEEVALEPGAAVRVRQFVAAAGKGPFGTSPLVYSVIYGIRPTGRESAVLLTFSWTHPELEEPLTETAHMIANGLLVEPPAHPPAAAH